ncbi:MAG: PKD domain-containing protein [Lewinellaceae bacterium]|nr:PKD domain-containing protein [Lewinellaceae bacterium]
MEKLHKTIFSLFLSLLTLPAASLACDGSGYVINNLTDNTDGTYTIDIAVFIAGADYPGGILGGTQGFYFATAATILDVSPASLTSLNGTTLNASVSGNTVTWGTPGSGPFFVQDTEPTQTFSVTLVVDGFPVGWNGGGMENNGCPGGPGTSNPSPGYSGTFSTTPIMADTLYIDTTICSGFPFLLPNGDSYDYSPGTNQDLLILADGPDVTYVFLNLEVIESPDTLFAFTACQGETIELLGQSFARDTGFVRFIPAGGFCDSLIFYELSFVPVPSSQDTAYVCNSNQVGQDTAFYDIGQACDSVVFITRLLTPDSLAYAFREVGGCPGDTLFLLGQAITADTVILEVLVGGAASGCDSITEWRFSFRSPQFYTIADIPPALCLGDSLTIVYGQDFAAQYNDYGLEVRGDSLPLPDGTGVVYAGTITAEAFTLNPAIQDPSEIEICINMEHSWMHDLDISLTCPAGNTIILQEQEFITNEVHLGEPYEADDFNTPFPPQPGTGYTYCWTVDAPNGTWTEFSLANDPGGPVEYTLPPGAYRPFDPLDNLVGCPWNGEWTLKVEDQWASDNGWVFFWSIGQRFAPADSLVIVSGTWADDPAAAIFGDTLQFIASQAGEYPFTYALTDTLGCVHDTTFVFEVFAPSYEERDTVLCRGSLLGGTVADTAGVYTFNLSNAAGCDSTVVYRVEILRPDTTMLAETTCARDSAGLFEAYFTGSDGCDSLVLTTVAYEPPSDTTFVSAFTCNIGQENELLVLQTPAGCDSLVQVEYEYVPLNYTLAIIPDTCLQGLGRLEVILADNPDYGSAPEIRLTTGPPQPTLIDTGAIYAGLAGGAYLLEITAGPNCRAEEEITIGSIGEGAPPNAQFNFSVSIGDVGFSALPPASGEQYFWNFGDGANGFGQQVNHQYPANGLYEACLTAVNECGQETNCQPVFVPFRVEPEGTEGFVGQRVVVPVRTNGVRQLGELNAIIQFLNPDVIQIDDIEPAALSAGSLQYDILDAAGFIPFSWLAGTAPGLTLGPDDVLFYIHLTLTGQPGDICGIVATEPPTSGYYLNGMLDGLYPVDFTPAFVEVSGEAFTIAGEVQTAPYHVTPFAPLANVEVSFSGLPNTSTLTGPDGAYASPGVPMQPYLIGFSKNNDGLNGLSGLGMLRLLRHLAGLLPFSSPYEYLASDVDCNEAVDINDVARLQEVLLGNRQAICESWRFVSSEYVFPDPMDPFQAPQTYYTDTLFGDLLAPVFYGVKTGDILGEADPSRRPGLRSDSLVLLANNGVYSTGDTITLTLAAYGFDSLMGFQFELEFDAGALAFADATAAAALPSFSEASFGTSQAAGGFFRTLWTSLALMPASLEEGEALIQLRFVAQQPIAQGLAPLIRLYGANLTPEAYDAAFERIPLLLRFEALTGTAEARREEMQLFQNQPNPYTGETAIPFYLPQGTDAELIVTGALGQVVARHRQHYAAGRHVYVFRPEAKLPAGIYTYMLRTEVGQATRRMVLAK